MSLLLNSEKKDSLSPPDSPASDGLDRALVEAAQEIEFDWPEFLPVERIKAGIMEIALGFLLFAGLVAFCGFHFLVSSEDKPLLKIPRFVYDYELPISQLLFGRPTGQETISEGPGDRTRRARR